MVYVIGHKNPDTDSCLASVLVSNILNKIKNGKKVIVDCRSNIVIINPSKKDIENYTILTENIKRYKEQSIIDIKEKNYR